MLCSTPKNDQYLFFFEGCEFHLTSYESKQVKIILKLTLSLTKVKSVKFILSLFGGVIVLINMSEVQYHEYDYQ